MDNHSVVTHDQWVAARKELLDKRETILLDSVTS